MSAILRKLFGLHEHRWETTHTVKLQRASVVTPSQVHTFGFKAVQRCTVCGDVRSVRI